MRPFFTSSAAELSAPDPHDPAVRIGVFIAHFEDSLQRDLWRAIRSQTRDRRVSVVGFLGHGLGSGNPSQATSNIVYRMARSPMLDGLIVFSNNLGTFTGSRLVSDLVQGLGLPTVSIGIEVPGFPTVRATGASAVRTMVEHLIEVHGRRQFALVTGPADHPESMEREAAVRETLQRFGLELRPGLVCDAHFSRELGREAARAFLRSGLAIDAVICLNDHMAQGVLEVFRTRGIRVPEEVSVTGFDDLSESRWRTTPLTTIRQPLEALAQRAVERILGQLTGSAFDTEPLECQPVFRRSCGCRPSLTGTVSPSSLVPPREESWEAVVRAVKEGTLEVVLDEVERWLQSAEWSPERALERRETLFLLREHIGPESPLAQAPGWFDRILAHWDGVTLQRQVEAGLGHSERLTRIREHGVRLLGTFRLENLARQWDATLSALGLVEGSLILFDGPVTPGGTMVPPQSRLVQWTAQGLKTHTFPTPLLFPPGPERTRKEGEWVVEPLVYQDEPLGYLVVRCTNEDALVYETLRDQVSTAVKATLLMEESRHHEEHLEQTVARRTQELRRANEDLRQQIRQRQSLEKEVQEVSHRTMQAIGQDIHDDLCQHLAGIAMLASVLEERTQGEDRAAVREIGNLLEQAVVRARQYARTLYPPGLEEHGLGSAIKDLVENLQRTSTGISLSFQMEGTWDQTDPQVALQLYRIIQESLGNAVKHSGGDLILLKLIQTESELGVEVRDFGKGMGPSAPGRGMGLKIMRYRAESIGAQLEFHNLEPGLCVSCTLPRREENLG